MAGDHLQQKLHDFPFEAIGSEGWDALRSVYRGTLDHISRLIEGFTNGSIPCGNVPQTHYHLQRHQITYQSYLTKMQAHDEIRELVGEWPEMAAADRLQQQTRLEALRETLYPSTHRTYVDALGQLDTMLNDCKRLTAANNNEATVAGQENTAANAFNNKKTQGK